MRLAHRVAAEAPHRPGLSKAPDLCHGDFLERVTPIGHPVSLDIGGASPDDDPVGIIAYANCNACGTTLAMATLDMPARLRREMLAWVQSEAQSRSVTPGELMESVRRRIQAISLAAWAAQKDESGRPIPPSGPPDA